MTLRHNPSPDVGLRDAVYRGWYNKQTGEVFTGFPVGPADTVVDVGCGDGGSAQFCASRGARLILADVDAPRLEAAAQRLRNAGAPHVETLVAGGEALPIPNGTATRIICTEVLEHVDSPPAVLAELLRIGQPGARYLLSVPDPAAEHLQQRVAPPLYFTRPNHLRIFEHAEFAQAVEQAGLVIEHRGSYGFFWTVWWTMFWSCGVDLANPDHPALTHWALAWDALMDTDPGLRAKAALDDALPKSQIIIARKP